MIVGCASRLPESQRSPGVMFLLLAYKTSAKNTLSVVALFSSFSSFFSKWWAISSGSGFTDLCVCASQKNDKLIAYCNLRASGFSSVSAKRLEQAHKFGESMNLIFTAAGCRLLCRFGSSSTFVGCSTTLEAAYCWPLLFTSLLGRPIHCNFYR
jgi:hypothetical protein